MDEPTRLTKTKEQWAKARRGGEEREVFYAGDERLPPGQHLDDHNRWLRRGPSDMDMGTVSRTAAVQGCVRLSLCHVMEPLRQPMGRG
jgi:formylglycine-generating enzyme required for sulfatase activity